MKERRKAGATHSFRLTIEASDIVDRLNHPRSLGGKSRLISDAIVYYFQESKDITIQDLVDEINLQAKIILALEAKKPESGSKVPAWWRRFWRSCWRR
jgi:hypothetical protein